MYNVNHNQSHMTLYLTRYLVYRGHFCPYLISKKIIARMNDGWNMDEGQYSKAAIPFQSNKILISYWKLLFHC